MRIGKQGMTVQKRIQEWAVNSESVNVHLKTNKTFKMVKQGDKFLEEKVTMI
jgi:hypothetical protein